MSNAPGGGGEIPRPKLIVWQACKHFAFENR